MIQGVSIGEMLNQSISVLTKPSITTFEQFEKHGGQREALTYIGLAAAVAAIAALVFGLLDGVLSGLLRGIAAFVGPVAGFYVFAFVLYMLGKNQGGTGTQDEVFYTCALYTAPILAITGAVNNIPVLSCVLWPISLALGLYQLYLGYLAARSSMNLDQNAGLITVVVAVLAQWAIFAIVGLVLGSIALALGIALG